MNKKAKIYGVLVLTIVALVGVAGLLKNSNLTGVFTTNKMTGELPAISGMAGINTIQLHRCFIWGRSHMDTKTTNCEGAQPQKYDGPLGYLFDSKVSGTTALYRCFMWKRSHMTTKESNCEAGIGPDAKMEGPLGYIFTTPKPGTTPLYRCFIWGKSHLTTLDKNCEGTGVQPEGILGYISISRRICGNGVQEFEEECDDGNINNYDKCSSSCKIKYCGNGIVDFGEECDDGNPNNGDGCTIKCKREYCGNSVVDPGEECDDGNTNPYDSCKNCKKAKCGDGTVQRDVEIAGAFGTFTEYCDDGNTVTETYSCGNGILENGAWCNNICSLGGYHSEQCDDGNVVNGDGCSSSCNIETIPNSTG